MRAISIILILILLTGCQTSEDGSAYEKITPEQALELMDGDAIILDVRTSEEYATGHVPGAMLLPVDDILAGKTESLPDKEALILVYCRSGNRSKTASNALVEAGYTQIKDFGGIIDWPYDVEK